MQAPLPHLEQAQVGLERHFALARFRPGQAEVISAVLSRRNVVVVMPTGAGKSLCYQLPALLLPGVTLVVSPLIALMQDQVDALRGRGLPATFINSTLGEAERAERMRALRAGEYKLVYVAPERLRHPGFLDALAEVGVELFAVDEAHCISAWGHDFRPDYAQLGQVRRRLRPPRTIALTATATPEVREDIVRSLLMKDPLLFAEGFDRPNLFLDVAQVSGDEERREACALLAAGGGSGIVYCSTRRSAEGMHAALGARGVRSVLYHAGMEDEARRRAQEEFMGARDAVVVATNAFGMGIDKPDIRFVAHANIPRAVEAYYQEVGRAGRDGAEARAVLLFNHADVYTQERLIRSSHPSEALLADVWGVLQAAGSYAQGLGALAAQVGASEPEVGAALRVLERAGRLERGGRGEGAWSLTLTEKAQGAQPHAPEAQRLLRSLLEGLQVGSAVSVEVATLARRCALSEEEVRHALALLERSGALRLRRPFGGRVLRPLVQAPFHALGLDLGRVREAQGRALLLLRRMTDYAYARRCRRAFILRYFGQEDVPAECGRCDVCVGTRVPARTVAAAARRALPAGPPLQGYSELALGELRRWRKELARDLGIPPFLIFNDETLRGLAAALPTGREAFLAVKGTGESRWERFGPKVVEVCLMARAAGDTPLPLSALPQRVRRPRAAAGRG